MASFSFRAGNAAKLLRIPAYTLGRLATALIPRTRRDWVFGCAVGVADGALALCRYAVDSGERVTWIARDDADAVAAAQLGIPSVRRGTLPGFLATARARVIVVTHGFGDVDRYATSGAVLVQLWHGIPLKRIGLDAAVTTQSPIRVAAAPIGAALRMLYRRTQRRIAVLPAASHLVRGRLESAFALTDDRVPVTGEPRVDVLSVGTPEKRRAAARARIAEAAGPVAPSQRWILYAPTWRDGAPDPAAPTAAQWARLEDVLARHDAVLALRSHHLGSGEPTAEPASRRVRALGGDLVPDVTGLLPGFDLLVTDYSSLAYDAALVPLPTLFLAPDVDAYAATRGFYGTYADVAGDDVAADWDEAIDQLDLLLGDAAERERRERRARALSAAVHAFADGGNTARVYRAIGQALARRARTGDTA